MRHKIKKWIPFIVLITIAIIFAIYMFLSTLNSTYRPTTDSPGQIYREACSGCHGVQGEGKGLFPALAEETFKRQHIVKIINEGALMMPAFELLRGDTLSRLAEYVRLHKFNE